MVFMYTDEMKELEKIFRPYENGCDLVDSAPQEAIDAKEKFKELLKKQTEEEVKSWFE